MAFGDIDLRLEVGFLIELLCALEVLVSVRVVYLLEDFGLRNFVEVVAWLYLFHLVLEFILLHPS